MEFQSFHAVSQRDTAATVDSKPGFNSVTFTSSHSQSWKALRSNALMSLLRDQGECWILSPFQSLLSLRQSISFSLFPVILSFFPPVFSPTTKSIKHTEHLERTTPKEVRDWGQQRRPPNWPNSTVSDREERPNNRCSAGHSRYISKKLQHFKFNLSLKSCHCDQHTRYNKTTARVS